MAAIALAAAVLGAGGAIAEPSVGRVTVVDGDTLSMQGMPIRLQGVDTPESRQLCDDAAGKPYRCGQVAALALADKIGERPVSCEPVTFDRYGRVVAVCSVGGEDLNGWVVEQGLGMAYRKYSGAYIANEDRAREAKRRLWAGTFMPPWDWRKIEKEKSH